MHKSNVRREAGATATAHPGSAAAPPSLQKPRAQPLRVKTAKNAVKQTKHKKRNPNADHAFNHRAQFTKFKRRIHAQRRWVLEGHKNRRTRPSSEQERKAIGASVSSCTSISEHDAQGVVSGDEASSKSSVPTFPRIKAAAAAAADAAVMQAVESMDALFVQLDAAMKQRRFGRAAFLKRCLRSRRNQLRRELQSKQYTTAAEAEADDGDGADSNTRATKVDVICTIAAATAAPAVEASSTYRSFHPSSTWLGMGSHPLSGWVDQRSGRYPKTCSPECIQFVLRNFRDGTSPDRPAGSEDYAYLIPTPPPASVKKADEGSSRTGNPAVVSPPPTPALTRAQRQQKASLYVASYCTNILTDSLDDLCFTLLQGLYKEQRDLKQKQPLQFKARQRYVVGFQEVLKCLKAGRVKLVLLAADVESVDVSEAALRDLSTPQPAATPATALAPTTIKSTRKKAFQSLFEAVTQVQQLCSTTQLSQTAAATPSGPAVHNRMRLSAQAPPLCVTCMSRQRLSYALYAKSSKIACVGVMQAEKNRDAFKAVVAYGRLLARTYANEVPDGPLTDECNA